MKKLLIMIVMVLLFNIQVSSAMRIDFSYYAAQEIPKYTDEIAKNPKNINAYLERGINYVICNEYRKAIADLTQVILLDPKNDDAYYWRGDTYFGEVLDYACKEEEAIKANNNSKAIEYKQCIEEARKKAISDLSYAIVLNPKNVNAYALRARVYDQMGQNEWAILDYTEAIKVKPTGNSDIYNERAKLYEKKGENNEAIADYTAIISFEETCTELYMQDVERLLKDDYDKLIAFYTSEINKKHLLVYNYYERGNVYMLKGDYDAALGNYDKVLEISNYTKAYLQRGKAYEYKKEYDKAIIDYTYVLTEYEGYYTDSNSKMNWTWEVYYLRGNSYYKKGEYKMALADCNKALEYNPQAIVAQNLKEQIQIL